MKRIDYSPSPCRAQPSIGASMYSLSNSLSNARVAEPQVPGCRVQGFGVRFRVQRFGSGFRVPGFVAGRSVRALACANRGPRTLNRTPNPEPNPRTLNPAPGTDRRRVLVSYERASTQARKQNPPKVPPAPAKSGWVPERRTKRESRVDQAYAEIRRRILDNYYAPGHHVLEQELAADL